MIVYSTNHFRNIQMPSNNKQLLTTISAGPAIKPHLYNPAVEVDQVMVHTSVTLPSLLPHVAVFPAENTEVNRP
jgi:hypothetical protein